MRPILALIFLLVSMLAPHGSFYGLTQAMAADRPVTVFAAASLTNVVTEAAKVFEQETGRKVRLSFAGSSTLARQIEAGADADLYLSANTVWADYLLDRNLLDPAKQFRRLSNQLVLVTPADNDTSKIETLTEANLISLLGPNGLIAMGDPDHVPAGIYGKQALQVLQVWTAIRSRVARADNVRGALALVSRGEVPLAIVYQSDIVGLDRLKVIHHFDPRTIDIRYAIEKTVGDKPNAVDQFYTYLIDKEGLARFEKYGFTIIPKN